MSADGPTNLIALRDGKQRAEALITTRYAEGLIDDDELDVRLDRLNAATSVAVLDQLVADLVDPAPALMVDPAPALMVDPALAPTVAVVPVTSADIVPASAPTSALVHSQGVPAEREITAMFGSIDQRGDWVVARRTRIIDMFASARLDLREAVLGPGLTLVRVNCVCASLEMIVPPQLAVRVEARVMFSSFERSANIPEQPRTPEDPLVLVTGLVLFSSFELRERLPGESGRQARRRHRALRKAAKRRMSALPKGDGG